MRAMIIKSGGEYRKIFEEWSAAFRWSCCGLPYDSGIYGCDHHGARGRCTCDMCRYGDKRGGYKPKPCQSNR